MQAKECPGLKGRGILIISMQTLDCFCTPEAADAKDIYRDETYLNDRPLSTKRRAAAARNVKGCRGRVYLTTGGTAPSKLNRKPSTWRWKPDGGMQGDAGSACGVWEV